LVEYTTQDPRKETKEKEGKKGSNVSVMRKRQGMGHKGGGKRGARKEAREGERKDIGRQGHEDELGRA